MILRRTAGASSSLRTKRRNDVLSALLFATPNLVGFLVFTSLPVLFSLGMAFTNWDLRVTVPLEFTGVENFSQLLGTRISDDGMRRASDPEFWQYLFNTGYLMLGIPIGIAGSLFLAVVLSGAVRARTTFRTIFFLPTVTSGVALFILWKALLNPEFGPINDLLRAVTAFLGLASFEPPAWLADLRNVFGLYGPFGLGGAKDAIILMGIWAGIGGTNMILYLAGLSNIPPVLYEAAAIDGAGPWQRFRHVTWPQLAPTTFFIVVMSVIGGLQGGFEQARVMTNGGPSGTTTTLGFYVYILFFEQFRLGYACAVGWILFTLIFALTALNWRFGSRAINE